MTTQEQLTLTYLRDEMQAHPGLRLCVLDLPQQHRAGARRLINRLVLAPAGHGWFEVTRKAYAALQEKEWLDRQHQEHEQEVMAGG